MTDQIFSKNDLQQIQARGIAPEKVRSQLDCFGQGVPYVKLDRPCTIQDGITVIDKTQFEDFRQLFSGARDDGRVIKFVPASGAASRMFQCLAQLEDETPEHCEASADFVTFIKNLRRFAFYPMLKAALTKKGKDLESLLKERKYNEIISYLLGSEGLNFLQLPKGLIPFHAYNSGPRTALQEHLVEGSVYSRDIDGRIRLHFTVSAEHRDLIEEHLMRSADAMASDDEFEISYSEQKSSTDTIAVDENNLPFRSQTGELIFRPGGHGALIENLNDLREDIVFIKNVDNIVPDRLKETTSIYKELIGGYLVYLQDRIFYYLKEIDSGTLKLHEIEEAFEIIRERLGLEVPAAVVDGSEEEKRSYIFKVFNRPLRICGVVRNEGEPGGGPFWVQDSNGNISAQIVESSQVHMAADDQKKIGSSSTHFNPVDLVCGVRDFRREPFDLLTFVDETAVFISKKSHEGRELKALELPGLWNGAMAYWNTVFIEVPIETFNPVKTVLDLLREQHQP